jgi:hypothetical protein
MKRLRLIILLLVAATPFAAAQNSDFPGVQKAMSPEQFEGAGLSKLSPEERAQLDQFIRGYVSQSNQQAATAAVDRAVKDRGVAEPEVIQSNIVGVFKGYTGQSRFTLANGQVWKQAQGDIRRYPSIDSPPVIIVKASLGSHRMYIAGGGNVRVIKVR